MEKERRRRVPSPFSVYVYISVIFAPIRISFLL